MVVGQDLGITLDMETFNVRAHAKGIRQATDLVVIAAAAADGEAGADGGSGGVALTLLHHPTGESVQRQCDWVVCAVHQAPEDALWQQLQAAPFEVHRIGDCVTPRRAHAAVIEGHRVAVAL
jgi:2,4-dienoyl-CoA reductase (NADPH2)